MLLVYRSIDCKEIITSDVHHDHEADYLPTRTRTNFPRALAKTYAAWYLSSLARSQSPITYSEKKNGTTKGYQAEASDPPDDA